MNNKNVAIIDVDNNDIGLKVLYKEEADYYYINKLTHTFDRLDLYDKHNIEPLVFDFNTVDLTYDVIFVIIPLIYTHVNKVDNQYIKSKELNGMISNYYYNEWLIILFKLCGGTLRTKKLCIVDNSDFDYCPINDISDDIHLPDGGYEELIFFKKKMLKNKVYNSNVYPFIYIDKNQESIIDIITTPISINENLINKIFFSGSIDIITGFDNNYRKDLLKTLALYYKDKIIIINKNLNKNDYYKLLNRYAFNLDLLSNNFPNKRTFSIMSCSGLRIGQREKYHIWGFDEGDNWAEETLFDTVDELIEKVNRLMVDKDLYNKCLERQNYIKNKYFTVNSIKNYLNNVIQYTPIL